MDFISMSVGVYDLSCFYLHSKMPQNTHIHAYIYTEQRTKESS